MHAPADTVQLILAESECLTQYLTTLPPAAWRIPSACERWEVRDVVAHLTFEAEMYTDVIARSVQGDASPPAGRPWSGPTTRAAFAEDTAQRGGPVAYGQKTALRPLAVYRRQGLRSWP